MNTTLKNPAKLAKYVKVYYKTADGRKIDLSDTNNYTIKVANKNIIPGEKVTLKVVGTAAVNALGAFTGVTLPVSLLSLAIAAVIGMPGVTAMLIFNAFL